MSLPEEDPVEGEGCPAQQEIERRLASWVEAADFMTDRTAATSG
jgi:hypothetical protein